MSEGRDIWGDEQPDLDGLLVEATAGDQFARWAAAFQLGELGDPRAARALRDLLADDDEHVREAAEIALRKLALSDTAARREARSAVAEHDAVVSAQHLRARAVRSHLEAEPFQHWRVKSVPVPDKGNGWVVQTALMDIVQVEGPITGLRLMRLYTNGCQMCGSGGVSRVRIETAIRGLIRKGSIARSDDFRSEKVETWVLHERGKPGVVLRQRGARELRDIPPQEVREAIVASVGRSARRGVDREQAFAALLAFYHASNGKDMQEVGRLLTDQWLTVLD